MTGKIKLMAEISALLLAISPATYAHHSFATHYDGANIVEISGR